MQGSEQGFKKKREEYALNVRRNNRQEILMKRRNIEQHTTQMIENEDMKIIDESMRTFLTEILKKKFEEKQVHQLIQMLKSENIYDKHKAVIGIRKLTLHCNQQLMDNLIKQEIIKTFISYSDQNEYLQLKLEALWVLTNFSSFSKAASQIMLENKIIPILSQALDHENFYIVYQAIWTVGNLAADDFRYRDELIEVKSIMKVLKFMERDLTNPQIKTSIWALTNLCRGTPPPKYDEVKFAIPMVATVLNSKILTSEQIIADCLWTLANLSEGPKIRLIRIMETKVLPTVMEYLKSRNLSVVIPAIRIVGNFTTGNKDITNEVINNNFFDFAMNLLDHEKPTIPKEICWALSNITAGTDEQILKFLQRQDLVQKILFLYPKTTPEVKSQIVWTFTNLQRTGIPEMILQLYRTIDLIHMIGILLNEESHKIVLDALQCLYRVLLLGQRCIKNTNEKNILLKDFQRAGYLPKFEQLQLYPSKEICGACQKIMIRFFKVEEEMNDA